MKALVTGGGGFLGTRITQMLHERGDEVVVLGRRVYPHHEKAQLRQIQADLRDADAIRRACQGMDVVFHVGALTGIWGDKRAFWGINVDGTRNVIEACRANAVPRLVYTSSPSVVFGKEDLCGVDESHPYPARYLAAYPETKAAAERLILAANDPELLTVTLRPHLVWGPGDPHLIPRVVERARRGQLAQVGDGRNLVDITYVDNAAEAHLLAADALEPGATAAGSAYFISQDDPVELWPWINSILAALGIPSIPKSISCSVAFAVGAVLEGVHKALRIKAEPRMTRFVAFQLAKHHYFNIAAAKADFGYKARVSTSEGLVRLLDWLRESQAV
ncbi:MAG: NAD-dependent epimerase/dehydratase family protein [Phycisphaerales bacterium]|nr:MAG: NAD-dependent epimerase/dehydratase family protein [Phycisphaerales bacterium]